MVTSMICDKCGAQLPEGSVFCTSCGSQVTPPVQPQQPNPYQAHPNYGAPAEKPAKPGMGLAIAALGLGIISLLCFPYITGVLGIIFGAVAKSKGCRSGMATAGIACGVVGVALWLLMLVACSGTGMLSLFNL